MLQVERPFAELSKAAMMGVSGQCLFDDGSVTIYDFSLATPQLSEPPLTSPAFVCTMRQARARRTLRQRPRSSSLRRRMLEQWQWGL